LTHRVVLSPRAAIDLEREADAVASLNPRAAERLVGEIEARCTSLAEFPLRFRVRDDLAPGLRMTVVRDWLIFYRASDQEVRIERILYGPRDIRPRDFG
jgi:toxin ParE1/3/4